MGRGSKGPRHFTGGLTEKEHIAVMIPLTTRMISDAIRALTSELERISLRDDCPYLFTTHTITGYNGVEWARNYLVGVFLNKTKANRLWFMDEDVIPRPGVVGLPKIDADIVTGAYPIWKNRSESKGKPVPPNALYGVYKWAPDGTGFRTEAHYGETEPIEVDASLMGMTLIRRKVLEDPRMLLSDEYESFEGERVRLKKDEPPPIFRTKRKANGEPIESEDFDFCRRARRLGYTIKFVPQALCGHIKSVDLSDVIDFAMATYEMGTKEAPDAAADVSA